MEKSYFRALIHTNQCELTFHLKIVNNSLPVIEADLRSVRQLTDTVQSLLQHTKNKIVNLLKDKENNDLELNITLTVDGKSIDGDTVCRNLIEKFSKPVVRKKWHKLILKVNKQSFLVVVNAPIITMLGLPDVLYVGYQVQATKFKALFAEKHMCVNMWYSSSDQLTWIPVGDDYKYTPSTADLNKYIKLKCTPQNQTREGPAYEIVSSSTVQQMNVIPKCPFEERHKLTSTKLKGSQLRIISYNTLSNLYCNVNQFPYCTADTLSIDYRKQLILKELEGYNADIICLQELDHYIFQQYLKPKFPRNYKGIFYKKGKRISEGLGCFFCSTRFRLLDQIHLVFAHELKKLSVFEKIWRLLQQTKNLKDDILKLSTSLQLIVLGKNDNNRVVLVANTHLYYHSEASEIRLIQASLALDYIAAIADVYRKKSTKVGIIFCGDFNSVPDSLLYSFITEGSIVHTFESNSEFPLKDVHLHHNFQFLSAYGKPKYTNYTSDFKGCLDYIFYEKNIFNVIDCVPIPDESLFTENTALPSKVFPSDHISLVANLEIA